MRIEQVYEHAAKRLGLDIDTLTAEEREELEEEVSEVIWRFRWRVLNTKSIAADPPRHFGGGILLSYDERWKL
jgi:ClpP class serine protease